MHRAFGAVLGLLGCLHAAGCTSTTSQSALDPSKVTAAQLAPTTTPPAANAASASPGIVPPAPAATPPAPGSSAASSAPLPAPPAAAAKPKAASGQQMANAQPGNSKAARVEFAPIVGATVESVAPLSKRLAADARARGFTMVQANDAGVTHVFKGYFSAFSEGDKTTVVYVWDVLDPAGNRLHRIQGQKVTTGAKGGGWTSVTPATMEAIADDTMGQFATWLSGAKT